MFVHMFRRRHRRRRHFMLPLLNIFNDNNLIILFPSDNG